MTAVARHELQGEILTASDSVRVIGSLHPLRNDRTEWHLPAGLSIAELLETVRSESPTRIAHRLAVYLDGHPIPEGNWHRVRPKAGTCLVFRARVEGGGGGLRNVLLLAVTVLALIVSAGSFGLLGAAFAAGTFGASALALGITVGGTLLVNTLFPLRPPETLAAPKERYSITGANNQATPYQPVPVVLGRHRIFPIYAAKPYTEIIGQDQFLRMFVVWGYGPLAIEDIKIGETPLSSFDNVEVQTDFGYDGDPTTALFPVSVDEEQLSIELKQNVNNDRTTSDNIDEIGIDITWPNGLYKNDDKGRPTQSDDTQLAIYYKLHSAGSYTLWQSVTVSGVSREVYRRGFRIVPGTRGQYDVRVVRTDPVPDSGTANAVWTAVRGIRNDSPVKFTKPVATTALRIRATDQLNGVINSLNGIVTTVANRAIGGVWTGTASTTNGPADLFRLVLQGTANARPVPDSKLDLVGLAAWSDYCSARGYKYNAVINTARSVYSQLQDIAAAGRATTIFRDGKWSVIWDDTDDDPPIVQHFTPRNSWEFTSSRTYKKTPHGWRVSFINETKDWQDDERIVYDDGYSAANATEFEGIEFPGVTNPDLIWKHGRFHIAQARLRPEVYQLKVDFENLVCIRGDRVRVTHDVPLWGQIAGRVKAVSGATVTVDEPLTMDGAKLYSIRFRGADGTSIYSTVPTVAGEGNTVTMDTTTTMPAVGDLFMFGERATESVVLRVLTIEPGDDMTATLSLVDDAPGINDADKGAIPPFDSQISDPIDPATLAPFSLNATEFLYASGRSILSGVTLSWVIARQGSAQSFELQRSSLGSPDWVSVATVPASQLSYQVLGLDPGTYNFRVRALFTDGKASGWTSLLSFQVYGLYLTPPDVTGFYINVLNDTATLSWNTVDLLNLSHYEIRFSPSLVGVTWGSSTPIQPHVSTTAIQVPSMSGTFLIKAVTQQGVYSQNATLITSDIPGLASLNAIVTLTEDPSFAGTMDGVELVVGELRLGSSSVMQDWVALSDIDSLYVGSTNLNGGGYYYFDNDLDLGGIYTSRVTSLVDAHGETTGNVMSAWTSLASISLLEDADPSEWDVTMQYRKSMVDPALNTWSGWSDLIVGDIAARALQFRIFMESTSNLSVVPVVDGLAVQIDMDDRIDAGADVVASSGGSTITFAPAFRSLLGLSIAAQNLATGDYYVITSKSETGFHIQFRNAAGTGISRTFDWVAKGYGRLQ